MKSCIIYMAINSLNGKRYIGITCQPLNRRIAQHFSHAKNISNDWAFYRAIRKHGRTVFSFSVLLECDSYNSGLLEEIRLIKTLVPEYNMSKGGLGGTVGRTVSKATRRKISNATKGKIKSPRPAYSENSKRAMRMRALLPENLDRWKQYYHLGSASTARPVICLTDGKKYPSASSAARCYSVAKSALIELCLGKRYRKTVNGLRFAYIDGTQNAAP